MRGNLNANQVKIENANKALKAELERKRKIIVQSKQIAYDMLSELYGKDGQELVDAVTAEHDLIQKFTDSGMTYADIEGLIDSSADANNQSNDDVTDKQTTFFENENPYAV